MTKKCPRCGYENSDTAEFCARCGFALVGFEQTVVPKVPKPSTAQQPAAPASTPSKPPSPPPQSKPTVTSQTPVSSSKPKEKALLKYVAIGLVAAIAAVVIVFFVLPMTSSPPPYVLLTSGEAAAIFGGEWNNPQIFVITYSNGLYNIQGVGSSAANPIGGYTYLPAYFGPTTPIVFNGYQEAIVNTLTTPLSSSISIQVTDFYFGSSKTAGQVYSSAVTQLASQGIAANSQGTFPAKTGVTYSYSFYIVRSDELLIAQGNNQVIIIVVKGGAGNPAFSASNVLQVLNYVPT